MLVDDIDRVTGWNFLEIHSHFPVNQLFVSTRTINRARVQDWIQLLRRKADSRLRTVGQNACTKQIVGLVTQSLLDLQSPIAVDKRVGSAAAIFRSPASQVDDPQILQNEESRQIRFVVCRKLLNFLLVGPWCRGPLQQPCHLFQIPTSLSERFDNLANSVRSLVGRDNKMRQYEQKRNDDWHVDVGHPVPIVQQFGPNTTHGGRVERSSFLG